MFSFLTKFINNNDYDKILDNLFIGNISASKCISDFDLIVNCTNEVPFTKGCKSGIRIPLNDTPAESHLLFYMITQIQSDILLKIHQYVLHNSPVLVHCYAGMQRSCAVVACYLIRYHNMNPQEAINFIKGKRSIAFSGRVNFIKTIEDFYLQENYNKNKKMKNKNMKMKK